MKYDFIKDMVEKKVVELDHCKIEENITNLFSKGVVKRLAFKVVNFLVSPLNF